jgi:Fe(3+) dicitrate transport protein
VCLTLAVLLTPAVVLAQASLASGPLGSASAAASSISVQVTDSSSAVVAGALVTIRALPGGQVLTSETDRSGLCLFPELPTGLYEVIVARAGFAEVIRQVTLGESRRQDLGIVLEVRGIEEQVTVVGETEAPLNELNGRAILPDIMGAVLFAGKKSDVLLLDKMDANVTTGNQRQVFAKIPGTQIWEHDSSGLQIGISNRGLDPNRSWETNQRMNGYDIMAEVFAYPDTYFTPPLDAVERIEMVRGSASLQYGAQFGGLVNYAI